MRSPHAHRAVSTSSQSVVLHAEEAPGNEPDRARQSGMVHQLKWSVLEHTSRMQAPRQARLQARHPCWPKAYLTCTLPRLSYADADDRI